MCSDVASPLILLLLVCLKLTIGVMAVVCSLNLKSKLKCVHVQCTALSRVPFYFVIVFSCFAS